MIGEYMINRKLISDFADIIGNLTIAVHLESLKDVKYDYEGVLDELIKWVKYYYENKNLDIVSYENSLRIHDLLDEIRNELIPNKSIGIESMLSDNILIRYEVIIKEINTSTDKYGRDHIDIYDSCPAENPDHGSIHINYDSDTGKGTIVDTTSGEKETTDTSCYLTTACMRHKMEKFDDNCEELMILRWFRDKFVSKEDIEHYYKTAPTIVDVINESENNNEIFNFIYENVVSACVNAIKSGNYEFAYNRYKNSVLALEEQFARPALEKRLVKSLKLGI